MNYQPDSITALTQARYGQVVCAPAAPASVFFCINATNLISQRRCPMYQHRQTYCPPPLARRVLRPWLRRLTRVLRHALTLLGAWALLALSLGWHW
jgi:hypothetical protein